MARLNIVKMVGLVVLLAIALALPAVLPKADKALDSHAHGIQVKVQGLGMV